MLWCLTVKKLSLSKHLLVRNQHKLVDKKLHESEKRLEKKMKQRDLKI